MKALYGGTTDGRLSITCWCERTVLWLPPAVVQAGLTESCGAPNCGPNPAIVTPRCRHPRQPRSLLKATAEWLVQCDQENRAQQPKEAA